MNAKELLLSNNYWVLNKEIVKEYGVQAALILSIFAEADNMFNDNNGWFFQTAETIEELTGMSNHIQTKAINKLKSLGIIEQKNQGIPMKRYFKINYETIENQVFKKIKNCCSKNSKTNIQNFSKYKESNYKKNKNKEINGYGGNGAKTSFTPPTPQVKYFIDFFNLIFDDKISCSNKSLNQQIQDNLAETDIVDYEDIKLVIDTYFTYDFKKNVNKTIWHLADNQIFKSMCCSAQLIDGNCAFDFK